MKALEKSRAFNFPQFFRTFPLVKTLAVCQYIDMVCIYCGKDTKVSNSRLNKRLNQVWRRRECTSCKGVFTTREQAETDKSIAYINGSSVEPFSREKLLLSVYESLRHRKTAPADAKALTDTIVAKLQADITNASITRDDVIQQASKTLQHFDKAAYTHYRAFHPLH